MSSLRTPYRYVVAVLVLVLVGYFGFHYAAIKTTKKPFDFLSKDRSENYRVKVVPASLSDEELNALPKDSFSYLAMIDAGSSGCRAHVYRYAKLGSLDGPLYVLPQHTSKKVKPGLSSFASNPEAAGVSLQGLVDFMKEQVPAADWAVTPIWLKATAGLRMVAEKEREAILDSVRAFLSAPAQSPFLFRRSWARVISGTEEGGFGWIAYNYLLRIIGPRASDIDPRTAAFAVIEMGGASAQVSQLAPSAAAAAAIPPEYRFSFSTEGVEHVLYTHSYLGYGAEQAKALHLRLLALRNATSSPCLSANTANSRHRLLNNATDHDQLSDKCVLSVKELFAPVESPAPVPVEAHLRGPDQPDGQCPGSGPFSFNCVHQPEFVARAQNILAFENFFYMASALGVRPEHAHALLTGTATNSDNGSSNGNGNDTEKAVPVPVSVATTFPLVTTPRHILAASAAFCATPWAEVMTNYPRDSQPKDVNEKMCFLSAFAYSFLVHGLRIPPHKAITIQREVQGNEIEWALGAAYKETSDFLKRTNLRPT